MRMDPRFILTLLTFIGAYVECIAAPGPPPPQVPPVPPGFPIDGGLLVLMVVGIIYGVFTVYKRQRVTD